LEEKAINMKAKILLIVLTILMFNISETFAQRNIQVSKPPTQEVESEDVMKTYVMVFLKKGANRNQTDAEAKKIQALHMEHLKKMNKDGMLLMAGPFTDEHDIKGILVMNSIDIDEVKNIVEEDPAIKAGRLIAEYHLWFTKSGKITLP
jgi:uncharacterized protein YciI